MTEKTSIWEKKSFVISALIISILLVVGLITYSCIISYVYEREIGSYMSNSIDMVAPEGMLAQLQLAKQAMIDSGLTEDDYGALIFKKPDNSMKFQYQHIDGIIERVESVVEWKEKTYGNESTGTETLGDVYEQKMTNLRRYIKGADGGDTYVVGTRSDWIAKDAWMIKNHLFTYLIAIPIVLIFLFILFLIVLIVYNNIEFKWYEKKEEVADPASYY